MFGSKERERRRQAEDFENLESSPLEQVLSDDRETRERALKKRRGAGGTSGGVVEFFVGLGMTVAGGYLITQQVHVTSGYWNMFGQYTFGLTLLPLLFRIDCTVIIAGLRGRVRWGVEPSPADGTRGPGEPPPDGERTVTGGALTARPSL